MKTKNPRYFIPVKVWVGEIKYVVYHKHSLSKTRPKFFYISNIHEPSGDWSFKSMLECVDEGFWREVLEEELALL